ncbi:hypothetical protein MA16_Dca004324 [Dendrobium catenatum]|uniref:Uncharacterized protein n=1 Tax=Dendrobium catenatum TaxID=906689 RepID=A0A2I0W748_9ASPA|nr:hypothetical protein MA16_Dca004324 [Dendrobium catenatum]
MGPVGSPLPARLHTRSCGLALLPSRACIVALALTASPLPARVPTFPCSLALTLGLALTITLTLALIT